MSGGALHIPLSFSENCYGMYIACYNAYIQCIHTHEVKITLPRCLYFWLFIIVIRLYVLRRDLVIVNYLLAMELKCSGRKKKST